MSTEQRQDLFGDKIEAGKRKQTADPAFDIMDALSAPVLTFSRQWADDIPKRILDLIPITRMIALMQEDQMATYAECVAYLFTRTLEAPMNSEWVDIYTHVSCRTTEVWFGEDHWEATGAPKALSDWLQSNLNDLRRHIYKKRRDILKGRLKSGEKEAKKRKDEEHANTVQIVQATLF